MADIPAVLEEQFRKKIRGKNKGAISAVIFDDQKILFSFHDGWIDKEKRLPPREDSLFMIGSNTKVLTSLGIFRLVEDGVLKLEDPITKYIPEFSVKSRIGEYEITVENLLMHRAGIQCDLYPYISGSHYHYTDIIDALKDTYRTSVPGTMFSYSNLGYALLGIIIERASGTPYPEFMQEKLLSPLDMEVYFQREEDLPDSVRDRVARSYDRNGKRVIDPLGVLVPAGSNTYTTLESLAKIGQLFMNEGVYKGKRLYKKETLQRMRTLKIQDEWDKELAIVGYGLYYRRFNPSYVTEQPIGHGGATVYHHSSFDLLPDSKAGIIVFSNFETARPVVNAVESDLFDTYLGELGFTKKTRKRAGYPSFDPNRYVKKYDTMFGPLDFTVSEKGQLVTNFAGTPLLLRLDNQGWLKPFPLPDAATGKRLPKSLRDTRLCQTSYCGTPVLIAEQAGVKTVIGQQYEDPLVSPLWLDALGTYLYPDRTYDWAIEKAVLSLSDGKLVLSLTIENVDNVVYLSAVNDTEAIVKGFGRNMKETVFLRKIDDRYTLTVMGLTLEHTGQ